MTHNPLQIDLLGEELWLFAERALYWPREDALLIADVHWGKDASFRARGLMLPDGNTLDTLDRLDTLLEQTGAHKLLVLGDLLHDRSGVTPGLITRIDDWRDLHADLTIELVEGNHDRHAGKLPESWRIDEVGEALVKAPFILAHEPTPSPRGYVIAGHLHPTIELVSRHDRLRLPGFVFGPAVGVLPAFNTFSGGPPTRPSRTHRTFAIAEGAVIEI